MNRTVKYLTLFLVGAGIYFECELHWRYIVGTLPVHWSMPVLGGVLFLLIGGINNWFPWEMPLLHQAIIGTACCTVAEFLSGCVLNLWLRLNVWDYSDKPLNLMGQVCPQFCFVWLVLSVFAIVLDDWLRYWLFAELKPHYHLF